MNKFYPFTIVILFFSLLHVTANSQDLIVTNVSGSKTVTQYTTLSVDVTIKNQGIVPINKVFQTGVYLSTDNVRSSDDFYLSSNIVSTLADNGEAAMTLSETISLNPGTYYVIVETDYNKAIAETDETNNQTVIANYVVEAAFIDFSFSSLTYAGLTVAPYDCMLPTYKIQNTGSTIVPFVYTSFYLSTDNTLDATDQRLGSSDLSFVESEASDRVPIPVVADGNYYIIARTDDFYGTPRYNETNESNNTQATAITIGSPNIDLDAATPVRPLADFIDGPIREVMIRFDLSNNGTTGAVGYDVAVYLSADEAYDEGVDLLVATETLDRLSQLVGASKTISSTVTVPVDRLSGSYYVVLKFNPKSSMPESDLSNNTTISMNMVTIPPPATIQFTNATINDTPSDRDKSIGITAEFSNPSESTFDGLVSYNVQIVNSAGTPLTSDVWTTYLTVRPNRTLREEYTISLTDPLPAGSYTIHFTCGDSEACANTSFTATLVIRASAAYSFNGSIRTARERTPLSSGKLLLYQKNAAGKVAFTQKIDPVTSSNFDFEVSNQLYTLYFIPDRVAYPKAIPTILGKTIVLTSNSFVRLTGNYTAMLEVLQITPLTETGNKIVSGNIKTESSNVTSGRDLASGQVPVVLLSDAGIPVAITYADADGNYEFTNLPNGNYGLLLSLDPDRPQMSAPVVVNVVVHNAEVNFDLTGATPQYEIKILQLKQAITFNSLAARKYGDAAFDLDADANSGLAATFASSNKNVAVIDGNRVTIVGAGTTLITAYQAGNADFLAATPVTQTLTVEKAGQSITFTMLPEMLSTDDSFELAATSSSSLQVTYVSGNESIASISGHVVIIHKDGVVQITALQEGDGNYLAAAPVSRELKINLVTAIDETLPALEAYPNPTRDLVRIPYDVREVNVADALGNTERVTLQDRYLDLTQRKPGLYLVIVKIGNTGRILRISKE